MLFRTDSIPGHPVRIMGRLLIRTLVVMTVVVIIGLGAVLFLDSSSPTEFTYYEDEVFREHISIRDTNRSLSSLYTEYIDDTGNGGFTLTMRTSLGYDTVEIDQSVTQVVIECCLHWEIFGAHDALEINYGAVLRVSDESHDFSSGLPGFQWHISSGLTMPMTESVGLTLNRTVLESLNATLVHVSYECFSVVDCEGSYWVNYAFSMDIRYCHLTELARVSTPQVVLLALSLCSVGLLAIELEMPNPQQPHIPDQ